MTRAKISEYSATANDNTDVNGINIAEGCPPSSMNNMGREIMAALKRFQVGSDGDGVTVGGSLVVSGSTSVNTFNVDVISEKTSAAGVTVDSVLLKDGLVGIGADGSASAPSIYRASDTNTGIFFPAADTIAFAEGGAEAMRIDSDGDVGIGTNAPARKLHVAGSGTTISRVENTTGTNSTYFEAKTTTQTAAYGADGTGGFIETVGANPTLFYTNGSERMRIDSSGNVGIGTSSPAQKFHVVGSNNVTRFESSASNISDYITFYSGGANRTYFGIETDTGTGILGSGTAYSTILSTVGSQPLVFGTNSVERARITSGGDLLVGTTTNYGGRRLDLRGSNNGFITSLTNSDVGPAGLQIYYDQAAPNGTGNTFLYCNDSGTLRAEIRSNGGLANYSANNVNLSDRREKTNFAPAKNYLDTICSIPVQTFNYVGQSEDDPGLTLGVVAQDVQEVAPELVMESDWSAEKDGSKMRLSIYQTDLQYALMKCIQELKAELDTVKAELATLKG